MSRGSSGDWIEQRRAEYRDASPEAELQAAGAVQAARGVAPHLDQLFIYGTLIPGEDRWPLLEDFVVATEPDSVRGRLFDTGAGYPAARFDATGTIPDRIQGLRMTLEPTVVSDCMEMLDEIEGAVVGLYHRVVIETDGGHHVWSYQYGLGFDHLTPIPSGSWARHLAGPEAESGPGLQPGSDPASAGTGDEAVPAGLDGALGLLTFVESRIIGSLVEKELATPQNYPLSLNALLAACNQATSRDPITDLSEPEVLDTLTAAKERKLVRFVHPRHGRGVTKYRHVLDEALGLEPAQTALLALLMLRGPQTARELRDRVERLHPLADTAAVEEQLDGLASRGYVVRLERQRGQRDERWSHLLGTAAN
jgi:uncharacterized protein YceH (UPF0502 family)/gamma-glutamylcyclotransferase (GGCT)/AIG2-like uncharacterized protein YtfP